MFYLFKTNKNVIVSSLRTHQRIDQHKKMYYAGIKISDVFIYLGIILPVAGLKGGGGGVIVILLLHYVR